MGLKIQIVLAYASYLLQAQCGSTLATFEVDLLIRELLGSVAKEGETAQVIKGDALECVARASSAHFSLKESVCFRRFLLTRAAIWRFFFFKAVLLCDERSGECRG